MRGFKVAASILAVFSLISCNDIEEFKFEDRDPGEESEEFFEDPKEEEQAILYPGWCTKVTDWDGQDENDHQHEQVFDTNGNVVEIDTTWTNRPELNRTTYHSYNSKNQLIETTVDRNSDGTIDDHSRFHWSETENGLARSQERYRNGAWEWWWQVTYDDQDRWIIGGRMTEDGELGSSYKTREFRELPNGNTALTIRDGASTTEQLFDERDNLLRSEKDTNSDGRINYLFEGTVEDLPSGGWALTGEYYNVSGQHTHTQIWTYDRAGNILSYQSIGDLFDSHWIQRFSYECFND